MIREEFSEWVKDLAGKLPKTGEYVANLPRNVRDEWFACVFSSITLEDAREANRRLLSDPVKNSFEQEALPAKISKLVADIKHERREAAYAEQEKKEKKSYSRKRGGDGVTAVMSKVALLDALESLADWGSKNPDASAYERQKFIDSMFPDDPENQPRYRCLECLDSGYVAITEDGLSMVAACYCSKGDTIKHNWDERGRSIRQLRPKHDFGEFNG